MTHALIANLRREGHWQLTDNDARAYAQTVKNVARHYSIAATQKALDWYALGMMVTTAEGSRLYSSYRNSRERRGSQPPQQPRGQVFQFRPPPPATAPPPAPSTAAPSDPGPAVEGFTGDGIDGPIGGPAE